MTATKIGSDVHPQMKYFEAVIILTAMAIVSFSMESCKKDTNQAVADGISAKTSTGLIAPTRPGKLDIKCK